MQTKKSKQIFDITELLNHEIKKSNIKSGVFVAFIKHTTAALATADLDPGTDLDMLDAFEEIIPKLKYRHPHDPSHVPDHILSSIIGASLVVPIRDGEADLGTWQRIVLIELNGPRERDVTISFLSE
jgi:secondary thiamine-phosphate synthase enzyme